MKENFGQSIENATASGQSGENYSKSGVTDHPLLGKIDQCYEAKYFVDPRNSIMFQKLRQQSTDPVCSWFRISRKFIVRIHVIARRRLKQ